MQARTTVSSRIAAGKAWTGAELSARGHRRRFSEQLDGNRQKKQLAKESHCSQCPFYEYETDTKFDKIRQKIHLFTEDPFSSRAAQSYNVFILGLVMISTVTFLLQSVRELGDWPGFFIIDAIIAVIFTVEYAVRIANTRRRVKFFFAPLNLIDLLAVVPFFLQLAFDEDNSQNILRIISVIRLARVFRLFRSTRLREFTFVLQETFRRTSDSFTFIIAIVGLALIIFSSVVFFAERGELDEESGEYRREGEDEPSPFPNIIVSLYWCLVTMTTVGYGDIFPKSAIGKILTSVLMIMSTLIVAFPLIIVGSHFEAVYNEFRDKESERRLAKRGKRQRLNEFVMMRRAELTAKVSEITDFFMNLENPTEQDAVRFRDSVTELAGVFDKYDAAQNAAFDAEAHRVTMTLTHKSEVALGHMVTVTEASSESEKDAPLEHSDIISDSPRARAVTESEEAEGEAGSRSTTVSHLEVPTK